MIQTLTSRVQAISPDVPAYDVHLMRDLIARSTAQRRFVMGILAGFAISALVLAGVGIFGIMSRLVTAELRTGGQIAPGATARHCCAVDRGAGSPSRIGGRSYRTRRRGHDDALIRALLFEVRPLDPVVFAVAVALLVLCIAVACFVPVWRATAWTRWWPCDATTKPLCGAKASIPGETSESTRKPGWARQGQPANLKLPAHAQTNIDAGGYSLRLQQDTFACNCRCCA